MGFAVDRAALGQVFSLYFGFPYQSFIPLIAPQSTHLSFSGLGSTPVPKFKKQVRSLKYKNVVR
jgi:hypothetical protein